MRMMAALVSGLLALMALPFATACSRSVLFEPETSAGSAGMDTVVDPDGLNLGDGCAYVACTKTGEALLFKGTGFSRTDVRVVQLSL